MHKMGSMLNNVPPNRQVNGKQAQIGQPVGDIPLMA